MIRLFLAVLFLAAVPLALIGGGPGDDQAAVTATLPAGAKFFLNDGERDPQRRLLFTGCRPGELYLHELKARYADGTERRRLVCVRGGWDVRVPFPRSNDRPPELVVQAGHNDAITSVAFSPDGRYLATASGDRVSLIWDVQTGRQLRTFAGHANWVMAVAFSPDGKLLAQGVVDGNIVVVDVATGATRRRLPGFDVPPAKRPSIWSIAFVGADRILAGNGAGEADLWDIGTGKLVRKVPGHAGFVQAVAAEPDGKTVLTGDARAAHLWDAATGNKLQAFVGHGGPVRAVAFHKDGKHILTASEDGEARLWDRQASKPVRTFAHKAPIQCAALSADGSRVITGGEDGLAIVWDTATGKRLHTLKGHQGKVRSIAFDRTGTRAVTGGWDQQALLWDIAAEKVAVRFESKADRPWCVALSPDGKHMVSGAGHNLVLLWDPDGARTVRSLPGHTSKVRAAAYAPDGKTFITGSDDRTAILWDARNGKKLHTFNAPHADWIMCAKVSPDGKTAATCTRHPRDAQDRPTGDGGVFLWDTASGKLRHSCSGHKGNVWDVAFSPDGKHLVSGGDDRTAMVWEVATGKRVKTFDAHKDLIVCVLFSPDGTKVLTGSKDTTMGIWDFATGKKLLTIPGYGQGVSAAFFTPDGNYVLASAFDGAVRLNDARKGTLVRRFDGHIGAVDGLTIHAGGRYFQTCGGDGVVRYWDIATGEELAWFVTLDQGKEWLVVTPDGLFDGSAGGRGNVWFRLDGKLDRLVQVDRFFRDYNRAGLLTALWRGDRPQPGAGLGSRAAPLVKVVTPQPKGTVTTTSFYFDVEVQDQGGGVGKVFFRHSGSRFEILPTIKTAGKIEKRRYEVKLAPGKNVLEVQAEGAAEGSPESEPVRMEVTLAEAKPKKRLFVLAVGVNNYPTTPLRYARPDAEAVANLFKSRGGQFYDEVRATVLVDDKATRKAVLDQLARLAAEASVDDTVVLYLAGHGTVERGGFYYIPHDYRPSPQRQAGLEKTALPGTLLFGALLKVPSMRRVVIVDACHSGAAFAPPAQVTAQVDHLTRNNGIYAIAAAPPGEEAQEPQSLGHGVLTYALLAAVRYVDKGVLAERKEHLPGDVAHIYEWLGYTSNQATQLMASMYRREGYFVPVSAFGPNFPVLPLRDSKK